MSPVVAYRRFMDDMEDDAAERAQALSEVLAGLMATALGQPDCGCRACTTLRNMDRVLDAGELD